MSDISEAVSEMCQLHTDKSDRMRSLQWDKVSLTCTRHGRELKGRDHLGDLDVKKMIQL